MSKPTCTIRAWLCQSQSQSFFTLFFSLKYYVEQKKKREKLKWRLLYGYPFLFFISLVGWKWFCCLCWLSVCRILFYLIIYDFCMCASCSRLGLWVYWSLWPMHLLCVERAFSKEKQHKNKLHSRSRFRNVCMELDRWYNDKNRMLFKKLYVF